MLIFDIIGRPEKRTASGFLYYSVLILGVNVISLTLLKVFLPFVMLLLPMKKMNLTVQFFTYSNQEKYSGRKRT